MYGSANIECLGREWETKGQIGLLWGRKHQDGRLHWDQYQAEWVVGQDQGVPKEEQKDVEEWSAKDRNPAKQRPQRQDWLHHKCNIRNWHNNWRFLWLRSNVAKFTVQYLHSDRQQCLR